MGQLEDLWVPRSQVQAEEKRRQDAEKRLNEVLQYLDPQPAGGPIYMAPFPEPGDLGQRMVALAEKWEREAVRLRDSTCAEYAALAEWTGTMAKELRQALGKHAAKGTEKPAWLYGPPVVTVHVEEGHEGMCIEPILVKVGAARNKSEANDLIDAGVVRIEECHVIESHWRGADQEFTLFVGDGFKCRVHLTSEPEPKGGIIIPESRG